MTTPIQTTEQQILLCLEWLDKQEVTKTINYRHTSYDYKHIVERWADTYISEDSFIEAVRMRGIESKRVPFTDKAIQLPLSEKIVRTYSDRLMKQRGGGMRVEPGIKREK